MRRARTAAGLSTARLADRLGVSQPTVVRYETGEVRPSPERVVAIAAALGVKVDALTPTRRR